MYTDTTFYNVLRPGVRKCTRTLLCILSSRKEWNEGNSLVAHGYQGFTKVEVPKLGICTMYFLGNFGALVPKLVKLLQKLKVSQLACISVWRKSHYLPNLPPLFLPHTVLKTHVVQISPLYSQKKCVQPNIDHAVEIYKRVYGHLRESCDWLPHQVATPVATW